MKSAIDAWAEGAQIKEGRLFRCVSRKESVWGTGITEKVIWHVVLVKNGAGTEPRAIDREKGRLQSYSATQHSVRDSREQFRKLRTNFPRCPLARSCTLRPARAYFFRLACQFSITVYSRDPLVVPRAMNRLPSPAASHNMTVETPRGCGLPARNARLAVISTAIILPSRER